MIPEELKPTQPVKDGYMFLGGVVVVITLIIASIWIPAFQQPAIVAAGGLLGSGTLYVRGK